MKRFCKPHRGAVALGSLCCLVFLVDVPAFAQQLAQVPVTHTSVPPKQPNERFTDIMDIDQEGHMLYLGDSYKGGINIFDLIGGGAPP